MLCMRYLDSPPQKCLDGRVIADRREKGKELCYLRVSDYVSLRHRWVQYSGDKIVGTQEIAVELKRTTLRFGQFGWCKQAVDFTEKRRFFKVLVVIRLLDGGQSAIRPSLVVALQTIRETFNHQIVSARLEDPGHFMECAHLLLGVQNVY